MMTLGNKIYTLATSAVALSATGACISYSNRAVEVSQEEEEEIVEENKDKLNDPLVWANFGGKPTTQIPEELKNSKQYPMDSF